MKYQYWANVIALDKNLGNQFATALDPDDGSQTFADRARVKRGEEIAWVTSTPLTEGGFATMSEFVSAGPYPRLNAMGFSDAAVAYAKTKILVDVGALADKKNRLGEHIAANGFTLLPPSGATG